MRLGMHHTLTTAALQPCHAASKLASLTPSALTSEQLPVISWHSWNASSCVPLTALQPACATEGPPQHQPPTMPAQSWQHVRHDAGWTHATQLRLAWLTGSMQ